MAVTISDIAKDVGVAQSTISTVLNNAKSTVRVSDGTRKRVLDAANRMNYRPSFSARSLARGKTMTLGLLCGDIQTPSFSEFASEALHEAERKNYHLLISVTEWDPKRELQCIDAMLDGRVDGAIILVDSLVPGTPQYGKIIQNNFPIVTIEHSVEGLPSVLADYRDAMDRAVELLKSLGHERIGYLRQAANERGGPLSRLSVFHNSCRKYDIQSPEYPCVLGMDNAIKLGEQLAKSADIPPAMIVYSDYAATGIIHGLHRAGMKIPQDMDIIGIDGTQWGEYTNPPLTTILQDRKQLASKAIDLLMEKINNPTVAGLPAAAGDANTPVRRITVPSRLIVRETTKQKQ